MTGLIYDNEILVDLAHGYLTEINSTFFITHFSGTWNPSPVSTNQGLEKTALLTCASGVSSLWPSLGRSTLLNALKVLKQESFQLLQLFPQNLSRLFRLSWLRPADKAIEPLVS